MKKLTWVASFACELIGRMFSIVLAMGFMAFLTACGDETEGRILSGPDSGVHADATTDASAPTCTVGDTQSCACIDGTQAAQICKVDGAWGTCGCTAQADAGSSLDASVADTGIIFCQPGGAQACTCADGRSGAQSCAGGTWGACMCTLPTADAGVGQCVTGATQSCTCTDGRGGAQTCNSSHAWDSCICSGANNTCIATDVASPCGATCVANGAVVCLWTPEQINHPVFGYCSQNHDGDALTPEQGDCNDNDRNTTWCHPEIAANAPPLCRNTSYVPRDPSQ